MHEYHEFRASRSVLIFIAAGHLAAALTIYFYFAAGLIKWSTLAALGLFATAECRHLIQHGIIRLRVIPCQATIELEQRGQPYFYSKYKVYQTRWFAILKLIDPKQNRTLILIPDSFSSLRSYRRLRQQIRQLERSDAA
jgi:hypothetical protein